MRFGPKKEPPRSSGGGPARVRDRRNAARCAALPYPLCDANPYQGLAVSRPRRTASRDVFARIEAAAIQATDASPRTTALCGTGRDGIGNPSTRTKSGGAPEAARPSRARLIARNVAGAMPRRSISAAEAEPTPQAAATLRIRGASSSRTSGARTFESSRPRTIAPGARATAAANTGPASAPLPASSTPATTQAPPRRAVSSAANRAATRARSRASVVERPPGRSAAAARFDDLGEPGRRSIPLLVRRTRHPRRRGA